MTCHSPPCFIDLLLIGLFRATARFAQHQMGGHEGVLPDMIVLFGEGMNQLLHRGRTEIINRHMHRGQRRREITRNRNIIKAGQRHFAGNGHVMLAQRAQRAQGHGIIRRKNRRGARVQIQQPFYRVIARGFGEIARHLE